jgi:hypothetical protein
VKKQKKKKTTTAQRQSPYLPCHLASPSTGTPPSINQPKPPCAVCNVRRIGLTTILSIDAASGS